VPEAVVSQVSSDAGLRRILGTRALTANIVNFIVGASIFVLPATVASVLGPASLLSYGVCALAIACVGLCLAEAGSRISDSGGPYVYVQTALGSYAGFMTGVAFWFGSLMLGSAAVAVALVASVGELVPRLATPAWQACLLVAVYVSLAAVNSRRVVAGVRAVEWLTFLKIAPLILIVGAGLPVVRLEYLAWHGMPSLGAVSDGSLILLFAFMGMEGALAPSGEIDHPARTIPRAIGLGLVVVTLLYMAVQVVAQGTLGPGLAASQTAPLAKVAGISLGERGRTVILLGTLVSTLAYVAGDLLASPRVLFAFGLSGHLPRLLARVHPRFGSPHVAIAAHGAAALSFALSGTFRQLAELSVVSTLLVYLLAAISVLVMRRRDIRTSETPFRIPGGPAIPLAACVLVLGFLSRATRPALMTLATMLGAATVLYLAGHARASGA
jgi:amino acid transporter